MHQLARKPGSVLANHLSSNGITSDIERVKSTIVTSSPIDHLLAANRVYLSPVSPLATVGSYPTRFILAPTSRGGFVSVALSLRLPLVAVNNYLSLRCPDFPRSTGVDRDQPII